MREFMFFIRKRSKSESTLSPERHKEFLKGCEVYIGKLKSEGKLLSAQPIEWSGTIIGRDKENWKKTSFDETGEVIGGYYHILAENIDEAISIAQANPEFQYNPGTRIEVRPLKMKESTTGFEYPTKE